MQEGGRATPAWRILSTGCPTVSARRSASGERGFLRASASGWRWPGRSSVMRPCCCLDEPTASLDGQTEADVIEAIGRLAEGRTVLMVAHRPALVSLADRVVNLSTAGVVA